MIYKIKKNLKDVLPKNENSRLQNLGLTPGTRVEIIRVSPFGDPVQIRYGDCDIVISKSLADIILERQCEDERINEKKRKVY